VAEINDKLVGFLIGFMSQSEIEVGYAHLGGVHPEYRKAGVARLLLQEFIRKCKFYNRSVVKSCTSPINRLSIGFHKHMGFSIEQGDGFIEGVPVTLNYLGIGNHKVLFRKSIE
jgi:GNAT superfamily N-acetyltransferase